MSIKRRKYSPAEELCLTTQVDGKCPLCGSALFYEKKSKSYKAYELAHIYPLNPTAVEIEELKEESKMNLDVNHLDNLIPLCVACHDKFDKPRTVDEYRHLASLKKSLIMRSMQQEIQKSYQIESDIQKIIEGLYSDNNLMGERELQYDPKSLSEKFDNTILLPTQLKIRHNVADYYQYIRGKLLQIEQESPNSSVLICSQVNTFYLKQKSLGLTRQDIFLNMVNWFNVRTKPRTIEGAEIVTSFFIQNCEVFE